MEEGSEVHGVDVAETPVFAMAACNYVELIVYHAGGVESSRARPDCLLVLLDFGPAGSGEVEDPEILHIGEALSSEDHEVGVLELCDVVGALPGGGLVGLGSELRPYFGGPVEDVHLVETLLVRASSSEDHHYLFDRIVVHGAVGAL